MSGDRDEPSLISFPNIRDHRGLLGVLEAEPHFGFTARRFYFLTDVGPGEERGAHAHKTLRQCIFALRGSVTVDLEKDGNRYSWKLDQPSQAVVVPPGCWRVLREFSEGSVVGVLASRAFDESDYIRDYDEFRRWEAKGTERVPYLDLRRRTRAMAAEIDSALASVMDMGVFIGGAPVVHFEREFASYCGAKHAVGVGNGLDALVLAMRAIGIGPGDSVVAPSFTFIATALAVSQVGADLILVDVDAETANMDPHLFRQAIRSDTKAVIPVHLYGNPAEMDAIRKIAEDAGLFVLEDAAQAHGARYRERRCGTLGHAACFSFYPTKNLGAIGDAGMFVTDDAALAEAVRSLGNYGSQTKYDHRRLGVNSRLDPIQAAVLHKTLAHLDGWNERRRELASRYIAGLSEVAGIALPVTTKDAESVWHVFAIRVKGGRRPDLVEHLQKNGVGINIHYPIPVHLQEAYRHLGIGRGAFPIAEQFASETLSLPLDPFHSDVEIDRVIDCVRGFFR